MAPAFTSALWFIAVIVMIPVALWLLKRTPLGGAGGLPGAAASGVPRNVAMLSLSPNQRIVTIEVGQGDARQWLVLGVTPNNISTLHSMAALGDAPAATAPLPSFAQLLGKLRRNPGTLDEK